MDNIYNSLFSSLWSCPRVMATVRDHCVLCSPPLQPPLTPPSPGCCKYPIMLVVTAAAKTAAAAIEIRLLIHSLLECGVTQGEAHGEAGLLLNVCVSGAGGPEHVGLLSYESTSHVGRLLLVGVSVLHHPVLADEALAAHVAGEGLLPSVKAHVASQISFVVELLRTDFTFVRLVSSVLGQVLLQQNSISVKFVNLQYFTLLQYIQSFSFYHLQKLYE